MAGWQRWLGLDYRSLALLRVGVALCLLWDLLNRSRSLSAHYTDDGVLTRSELLRLWNSEWLISLHLISGLAGVQAALLVLAALAALALLVGYRTRWAVVVSWLLLCSLQARNPLVLQGADDVLRLVLFWMMFLPTAQVASIDAYLHKATLPQPPLHFSVGGLAYGLQFAAIYVFSGLHKTGVTWHAEGSALYYALSLDWFARPGGAWLLTWPAEWLQWLTWFTWHLEVYGPFLLLLPGWGRLLGLILLAVLQLGINLSLDVGPFGWVMVVAGLGLLPPQVWPLSRNPSVGQEAHPPTLRYLAAQGVLLLLLLYMVAWNVASLRGSTVPEGWRWLGWLGQLDQRWSLFAPNPTRNDGWMVVPATLRDGTRLDVFVGQPMPKGFMGKPLSPTKPKQVRATFAGQRWQKYLLNLSNPTLEGFRLGYARYLCRHWNHQRAPEQQMLSLRLVWMQELTPAPGQPTLPAIPRVLWVHRCLPEAADPVGQPIFED